MPNRYDVIIVGGGMLGLSTAYHLARRGARILVLEAGELGGGSSAACTGRAQVAEGHLDALNLRLIREGLARLETLEDELSTPFEWHRIGFLALINAQHLWDAWVARAAVLTAAGIPTEMLDSAALRQAEPYLNADGFLGAAYAREGLLNPFRFCAAYAGAARRQGAQLRSRTPVTAMRIAGRRVTTVEAGAERFEADRVAVMCGAWTVPVARMAGVELPIHHTHAEALVTEPVVLPLHNTIQLASFYETIHGVDRAVSVGFSRDAHGALVVTEAVAKTTELHRRTSAWGLAGMAADLLRLYPALKGVRVVRGWGIPTPFSPDDEPLVGWAPGRDNLFVAAAFMQTITAVPLVSDWMAGMILGETPPADLSLFAPERFGALNEPSRVAASKPTGYQVPAGFNRLADPLGSVTGFSRFFPAEPVVSTTGGFEGRITSTMTSSRLPRSTGSVPLAVIVDGTPVPAYPGETVATVLLALGRQTFRHTDGLHAPRGLFCGMGVCFDCLVTIDGQPNVRACLTTVQAGMVVSTGGPNDA